MSRGGSDANGCESLRPPICVGCAADVSRPPAVSLRRPPPGPRHATCSIMRKGVSGPPPVALGRPSTRPCFTTCSIMREGVLRPPPVALRRPSNTHYVASGKVARQSGKVERRSNGKQNLLTKRSHPFCYSLPPNHLHKPWCFIVSKRALLRKRGSTTLVVVRPQSTHPFSPRHPNRASGPQHASPPPPPPPGCWDLHGGSARGPPRCGGASPQRGTATAPRESGLASPRRRRTQAQPWVNLASAKVQH